MNRNTSLKLSQSNPTVFFFLSSNSVIPSVFSAFRSPEGSAVQAVLIAEDVVCAAAELKCVI